MALVDRSVCFAERGAKKRLADVQTIHQGFDAWADVAHWSRIKRCAVFEKDLARALVEQHLGGDHHSLDGVLGRDDTRLQRDDVGIVVVSTRARRSNAESNPYTSGDQHRRQLGAAGQIVRDGPEHERFCLRFSLVRACS
jgi:hypothetical protein